MPDLENVFNLDLDGKQGLSEKVLDNFMKDWGSRIKKNEEERQPKISIHEVSSSSSLQRDKTIASDDSGSIRGAKSV